MTDQVHTITMSEEAQAAFESGRKIGFNEGITAASGYMTDRANGCPMHYMAETYRLYAEAIRALSMPAPTQGRQVKPMEFDEDGFARSACGLYFISENTFRNQDNWSFRVTEEDYSASYQSKAEAKAAAQADYARRISAAILTQPPEATA